MDNMTNQEVYLLIQELSKVFDLVRLVDVSDMVQISLNGDGNLVREPRRCYAVWKKDKRCENCISAKAFAKKGRMTKFEFVDKKTYHVVAMYVEVGDVPYILEMVSKVTDETLFGAYGENEFVETIFNYNKKMYIDPLTGAYNRRYYEDQLYGLRGIDAVAMVDVDDFKAINDTFGHLTGDVVLREIADVLISNMRDTDNVVRYGGDEFLMLFRDISKKVFVERLYEIKNVIHEVTLEEYPECALSVSIGGLYCTGKATDAIQEADRLMYRAKSIKNDVQFKAIENKY